MKMKGVLGLNSRNHLYTSQYNPRKNKRIADSKLETKERLKKAGIRTPKSYAVIRNTDELEKYDFMSLPEDFVIKPDNGLGGQGIMVVEKQGVYAGEWVTAQGEIVTTEDLKLHVADILAGQYAMDDLPDTAYIEERVRVHPIFAKYSYHGTPDIRVVVFNGVPIMSYVRYPTEESGGRANLFQGAAAVGIDIATGITTYGVHHAKQVEFLPNSRRKLRGIEIPQWDQILETAIEAAKAIGLGYMASDIVLQTISSNKKSEIRNESGLEAAVPMILEVNAQPGLKIQIANKVGLRERLERVKGLKIRDAKHGIRVAKALFADAKLMEKGLGRKTVAAFEEVEITGASGEKISVRAKIDTGADSSSIDRDLAKELGLLEHENFLYDEYFRNALGRKKREVVGVKFVMAGRKIKTRVSVADRSRLRSKFLVGRRDLKNFVVMVE